MKKINKKGMELSINFVVILILSIVIFGFGIKILSEIFEGANEMENMTQKKINNHIRDLMCDSSERICVAPTTVEARPHDSGYFMIRILNTDDIEKTFYLGVEQSYNSDIPRINEDYWLLGENPIKIGPNEQKKVGLGVLVPGGTDKGTYVLNVYVCKGVSSCDKDSHDDPDVGYGTTQKLYVVVP